MTASVLSYHRTCDVADGGFHAGFTEGQRVRQMERTKNLLRPGQSSASVAFASAALVDRGARSFV